MASTASSDQKNNTEQKPDKNSTKLAKQSSNNSFPNELNFDERPQEYLDKTKEKYFSQCESLNHAENQKNLLQLLSYERYNDYPIASYLIDSFLVDKFQFYLKQKENEKASESDLNLKIGPWAQGEHDHDILTNLIKSHKNNDDIRQCIMGGIEIYFKRYIKPMSFPCTTFLIDDKIERFAQCLAEANRLIKKIFKDTTAIPPFQVIFCFVFCLCICLCL